MSETGDNDEDELGGTGDSDEPVLLDGDGTAAAAGVPGPFVTFAGAGFGTLQIERAIGPEPTPASVSGRRYLRDNLPGMYADGDFAMRFIGAFETLLDPLVASLDNLPEHFDPRYAPRDVLDL